MEQNRKGSARLQVVDNVGRPIPGVAVTFQQTSHDFLFGAQPIGNNKNRYLRAIADLLRQAGLNYAQISASYGSLEPSPGQFDWTWMDQGQNAPALLDHGFKLMGDLAFWLFRECPSCYEYCPQYQDTMSFAQLQSNFFEHMRTLAARYRGRIDLWAFSEQNLPQTNVLNLTWDQKIELTRSAVTGLKAGNPEAKTIIVSTGLPYDSHAEKLENSAALAGAISFDEYINLLASRGITFDAIGLELYHAGIDSTGYGRPGLSMASLSRLLDRYAAYDKPIYIEEVQAPSVQYDGSNWWHRPWDEATQAEFLQEFYTIAFSKPLVQEIAWAYGVTDEETFIKSGGILDVNLKPKPAYFALKNLIASWTTGGTGTTDKDGKFVIKGFAGDYRIDVEDSTRNASFTVHITERKENSISLTVPNPTPTVAPTPTPTHIAVATAEASPNVFSTQAPLSPNPTASPAASRPVEQDSTWIVVITAAVVIVGLVLGISRVRRIR